MNKVLFEMFKGIDRVIKIEGEFQSYENSIGMTKKYNPKTITNDIRQRVHEIIEETIENELQVDQR